MKLKIAADVIDGVYEYHATIIMNIIIYAATFCKQIRLVTKGGKSKGKENPLYLRGCETLSVARQGQETPFISHSTPAKKQIILSHII